MKPFLEELAAKIIARHTELEQLTMVFPNRRASFFFRKYLSEQLTSPVWSPRLITIEELFTELSALQNADSLSLIFRLYKVYNEVMDQHESFDRFYFWGEMLLRDFDEVDKYVAPAAQLFKDLSNWRELDPGFETLTDEQKKFLRDFWTSFGEKPVSSKEEFLKVWRHLPAIYAAFTKSLKDEGIGYPGMQHRDVAEKILSGKPILKKRKSPASGQPAIVPNNLVFAGFNALTRAEEILIAHFVEQGAKVHWDSDPWYVEDAHQEAGQFFRQYKKHPVLSQTFEALTASNFKSGERIVDLYGVPQKAGQAKLLGELLTKEVIPALSAGKTEEVKTVVVLPDEGLLLSVLHSLPEALQSINVTMGYPLRSTPVYNLLELLIDLQTQRKDDLFSHRQVTAILAHPYVLAQAEATAVNRRLEIIRNNRIFISAAELQQGNDLLALLFRPATAPEITDYLLDIIRDIGNKFTDDQGFDREYAFHFYTVLSRFSDILKGSGSQLDLRGFHKLFRQVIQSQKIPFTGEPLKGIQVMGVLETRNLDFDNVFILSLNEGSLPAAPKQGSYIPHAIRKAYRLPTHDHQDAMYAYLFYRILQRAKHIRLIYNTEPDILGMGEMSRFVQQLRYESGWKINHYLLSNPVQLKEVGAVTVAKTPEVLKLLGRYTTAGDKTLSPSVLNDYVECSLRFYLKHLARLREADEVEEDLDARIFGNFLHDVMDWFYSELQTEKKTRSITAQDLHEATARKRVTRLIDRKFHEHYEIDPSVAIEYVGQRVLVREIVLQFALQIIRRDSAYAPFDIEMLEAKDFKAPISVSTGGKEIGVNLGGRIDRIDSKDGVVRVIDYKTGGDRNDFKTIESLFARTGKRNKGAFQTSVYAWLYDQNAHPAGAIRPLLISRRNLSKDESQNFKMGGEDLADIKPHLPEFEKLLKDLLAEVYNPDLQFVQTPEEKNCEYCNFKNMCRR